MTIIFHIDGGLGKHILATAVLKAIKKFYPEHIIKIVCSYPDVFKHNPNVDFIYQNGNHGNFYLEHIKEQEHKIKLLYADPYTQGDFILSKKHLLRIWLEQWNIPYNGEKPEIFLSPAEVEYLTPFYKTEKPILAIHPNGGPTTQGFNYSWTRDLPESTVLAVIEEFKKTHTIVHIKRENQKEYPDTLHALDSFRSIAVLLQMSDKRLLIDSFSQHLAAAFSLPSLVCWVTTDPEIFGYDIHNNIRANRPDLLENFTGNLYQGYALSQDIHTCPYTTTKNIFSDNEIIYQLKKTYGSNKTVMGL